MKLIEQPLGSRQCGQACIAMLCNMPLEDVVLAHGDSLLTWREIHTALFLNGCIATEETEPAFHSSHFPKHAVALLPGAGGLKHAVVVVDEIVYDPARGCYPTSDLSYEVVPRDRIIKFAKIKNL